MQIVTAQDIYDQARFFMNDSDADVYTNSVLRPGLNIALDMLRQEMETNNIAVTHETSAEIEIEAGVTEIGSDGGPALPNDFLSPTELWEKQTGSNQDYMIMKRRDFLPKTAVLTSYLQWWSYQNQKIKFLGANGNVSIKIDYIAHRIFDVISENKTFSLINSKLFLSSKTASLCSNFIAENPARADELAGIAQNSMDNLLILDIKNQQGMQARRRPFMASYKRRGGLY
jgi:hypothetical protein